MNSAGNMVMPFFASIPAVLEVAKESWIPLVWRGRSPFRLMLRDKVRLPPPI